MGTKLRVAAILTGLINAPVFAAGVYKWVDAQGHFHFSDTAQPGWRRVDVNPTVVDGGPIPNSSASADSKRAVECQQKRDALVGYKASARIVERNSLGVEHEYTPEEKQKLIALTEQQLAGCPPVNAPADDNDSSADSTSADSEADTGAGAGPDPKDIGSGIY